MSDGTIPLRRFLGPRYWHVWAGLAGMLVLAWFPRPLQRLSGRGIGWMAYHVIGSRRQIAEDNIARCFPQWPTDRRQAVVREHFYHLGQSLVDLAHTWFSHPRRMPRIASIDGLEHLHQAESQGKGVILLLPHVTCTEIGARLLLLWFPFHAVYRRFENPLFQEVMHRCRTRLATKAIPKDNIRQMVKSLRGGHAVLYMPDQAYTGKGSLQIPFFGVPAPTNPGTARLARISGAPVVVFYPWWDEDAGAYRLELTPAVDDFPSDDATADAVRISGFIEDYARRFPAQYLWIHRRFKALPTEQV